MVVVGCTWAGGEGVTELEVGAGTGTGAVGRVATTTPGDFVGIVTDRLLNVCGGSVAVTVIVLLGVGVAAVAGVAGLLVAADAPEASAFDIPRILSPATVSKQPTYTPDVVFIGRAKQDFPAAQGESTKDPALLQLAIAPSTHATEPDVQLDVVLRVEKSAL